MEKNLSKEEIMSIMPPPCLSDEFESGEIWRIDEVVEYIQKNFELKSRPAPTVPPQDKLVPSGDPDWPEIVRYDS